MIKYSIGIEATEWRHINRKHMATSPLHFLAAGKEMNNLTIFIITMNSLNHDLIGKAIKTQAPPTLDAYSTS
jgi:hypothetical protein